MKIVSLIVTIQEFPIRCSSIAVSRIAYKSNQILKNLLEKLKEYIKRILMTTIKSITSESEEPLQYATVNTGPI